jgi:hypothetical protein
VFGANILKEGSDPKIQPDSEYPDLLWHLLDKLPVLSELRRKDPKALPYEDLKCFVKLDNRARIKENNALTAKNWPGVPQELIRPSTLSFLCQYLHEGMMKLLVFW